jgi:hypothetical protein
MNLKVPHPRFLRVGSYDLTSQLFFSPFLSFSVSSVPLCDLCGELFSSLYSSTFHASIAPSLVSRSLVTSS